MAYIGFRLDNANGFAGYVSIDGGKEQKITDGLCLRVNKGLHSIKISSNSSLLKAGKLLANLVTDGTVGNGVPDEYALSENFNDNTLVTVDIITDSFGKMSYAPTSRKVELDAEQLAKIESELTKTENEERRVKEEIAEDVKKKSSPKTFLLYALFSFLTFPTVIIPFIFFAAGYVKELKFKKYFGYKPKYSGLQGLVSLISTIGGIIFLISMFG